MSSCAVEAHFTYLAVTSYCLLLAQPSPVMGDKHGKQPQIMKCLCSRPCWGFTGGPSAPAHLAWWCQAALALAGRVSCRGRPPTCSSAQMGRHHGQSCVHRSSQTPASLHSPGGRHAWARQKPGQGQSTVLAHPCLESGPHLALAMAISLVRWQEAGQLTIITNGLVAIIGKDQGDLHLPVAASRQSITSVVGPGIVAPLLSCVGSHEAP